MKEKKKSYFNSVDRFYKFKEWLYDAFESGDLERCRELALEYILEASKHKTDKNYGNAIHQANTYMGLITLKNGDVNGAKRYLLMAAQTPGSKELGLYGPNMILPRELLRIGERQVVLEYLDKCMIFWKSSLTKWILKIWIQEIENGILPHFHDNLTRHISIDLEQRTVEEINEFYKKQNTLDMNESEP